MHTHARSSIAAVSVIALVSSLLIVPAAMAQDAPDVQALRQQYDALMANYERLAAKRGDSAARKRAREGRMVMRGLSDQQVAAVFKDGQIPDLGPAVTASDAAISSGVSGPAARSALLAPGAPALSEATAFPQPVPVVAGCNGVDTSAETRYQLFLAKEVANAILAAAAWVCNEDILGENGSAACVPLAIAADVANGFFDTATFCAGELTANQVDANFNRLDHIHNNLHDGIDTIVATDNANASAIVINDNTNTSTIVTNDNTNTSTIVANDNANTAAIIANANANKNELRDLILRTQIEADLSTADSAAVVVAFELPAARGGYLDLVKTIVTQTLLDVAAAGGSIGNAQPFLDSANAAKAAGDFKGAYASYRKAYKAAGK